MRIHGRETILGTLTDGKTWHVFKLLLKVGGLFVQEYYVLCSRKDEMIIKAIPVVLKKL